MSYLDFADWIALLKKKGREECAGCRGAGVTTTIKVPDKDAAPIDRALYELQSLINETVHDAVRDRDPYKANFDEDAPLSRAIRAVISASQSRPYRTGWNDAIVTMQIDLSRRKTP